MNISKLITKKSYERIEHTLRRHPLTFVPTLILFVFLLAIPFIITLLLERVAPDFLTRPTVFPLAVLLATVYTLSTYLFFFTHFVDYYLDLWIVTNDRIIDIEQQGIFSRTITELDLFQVQDVTTEIKGFMPTLFHYGNVKVKTASSNIDIVFKDVHRPNKVREHILILADEDRRHHRHTDSAPASTNALII